MFDTKFNKQKNFRGQVADAADLVIDFATLGEYGLEPVAPLAHACEGRRRGGSLRSTGTWHSAIDRFATHS